MIALNDKAVDRGQSAGILAASKEVTPELASYWLKNQVVNRRINETYVSRLVEDMKDGRWVFPGDPLKFNSDGKLIDGQHRLSAVIKSGLTISFVVLNGYVDESMLVLDLGKSRSADHVGQILGLGTSTHHTSCINALTLPLPLKSKTYSIPKILNLWEIYSEGVKFACQSHGSGNGESNIKTTAPFKALIAKAYYYENTEVLKSFCRVFVSGFVENGDGDEAAVALHNSFMKLRMVGVHTGAYNNRIEWYLKTQQALNYFISRKPVRSINKPKKVFDSYPLPLISDDTEENRRRFKALNILYHSNPKTPVL